MEAFSKRLRQLRLESGLKQEDLCADLNLSRGIVSAYEHGREPSFDTLVALARYFNVTTDYMLGVSQERAPTLDELTSAVTLADKAASDHDAPAVTASRITALARSLAAALDGGCPGAPEAAALSRQLVDGLQLVVDAIAARSAAQVLDAVNRLLAAVTSVNRVLTAWMTAPPGRDV